MVPTRLDICLWTVQAVTGAVLLVAPSISLYLCFLLAPETAEDGYNVQSRASVIIFVVFTVCMYAIV